MTDTTRRPVFRSGTPSYWRGSRSRLSIPDDAILTEDGDAIMTEDATFMMVES